MKKNRYLKRKASKRRCNWYAVKKKERTKIKFGFNPSIICEEEIVSEPII